MNTDTRLIHISAQDLLRLGGDSVAFIKPRSHQDDLVFAVFAADGTPLMEAPTRAIAEAAIRQNGLEPMSVH